MTDKEKPVERLSPFAVDGGCDAYGDMEYDDHGDYVTFGDYAIALDRAEKAEAALAATPDRTVYVANHRQAHCINVTAASLGPEYAATIDGLPKAARHMRERVEKAEAYAKKTTDQYFAVCLERDAALAESERLRDGIEAVRVYVSDTLAGPSKRSDDTRDWQRGAVLEVHKRCCLLTAGYHWDAVNEDDTPEARAPLKGAGK